MSKLLMVKCIQRVVICIYCLKTLYGVNWDARDPRTPIHGENKMR